MYMTIKLVFVCCFLINDDFVVCVCERERVAKEYPLHAHRTDLETVSNKTTTATTTTATNEEQMYAIDRMGVNH